MAAQGVQVSHFPNAFLDATSAPHLALAQCAQDAAKHRLVYGAA